MAISFDFKRRLGAGRFGEVWLAIDTGLNTPRAVKLIIPSNVFNPNNFFQEAQMLKSLEHPNIVRVEETGKMPDDRIYIAMEYIRKGSLDDKIKGANVDLSFALRTMIDVLRGLEYVHSKKILHRDIKPANILMGENFECKLSDFGLAIPVGTDLNRLGIKDFGYIFHLAPEVLTLHNYSVLSDIYACGITLYRLVNGDNYLPQLPMAELHQRIIKGTFPERANYRYFIPRSIKMIINKAMNINPVFRFQSAEDFKRALEKIKIFINWGEKILPNRQRWRSSTNNVCYEIKKIRSKNDKWQIDFKKGKTMTELRKVNRLCFENLKEEEAIKLITRILQNFTCGKDSKHKVD